MVETERAINEQMRFTDFCGTEDPEREFEILRGEEFDARGADPIRWLRYDRLTVYREPIFDSEMGAEEFLSATDDLRDLREAGAVRYWTPEKTLRWKLGASL